MALLKGGPALEVSNNVTLYHHKKCIIYTIIWWEKNGSFQLVMGIRNPQFDLRGCRCPQTFWCSGPQLNTELKKFAYHIRIHVQPGARWYVLFHLTVVLYAECWPPPYSTSFACYVCPSSHKITVHACDLLEPTSWQLNFRIVGIQSANDSSVLLVRFEPR